MSHNLSLPPALKETHSETTAKAAVSSGSQGSVVTEDRVTPDLPSWPLSHTPALSVCSPRSHPAGLGGPLSELTPWLETLLCIAL